MLKLFLYGLLIFSLPSTVGAQESQLRHDQVPTIVQAAVQRSFSKGQVTKWSRESENGKITYEASVEDSEGKRDAVFSEEGKLLAVEQVIPVAELPKQVKDTITSKYPKSVLQRAEKITHDGSVDYEVDLAKSKRKEITISSSGKILKEE